MRETPRSKIFDDVYFSAEDGLAETRHVFLEGNELPDSWLGRDKFVIAETGFGTGLNFIATWHLFEKTASPEQTLFYISIEKYPLSTDFIGRALYNVLSDTKEGDNRAPYKYYVDLMLQHYPPAFPGYHRIMLTPRVILMLIFDDVNTALPALNARVDCWFLDGFKPASNPDMWSETVFKHMSRLSRPGTRFATFTAAGAVRRGLETAGFEVRKAPGFGRKREMLIGRKTHTEKNS